MFSIRSRGFAEAVVQRHYARTGVLRNFAKLTGKHLYQRPSFNRVAGWGLTLLKKRLSGTGVFL